MAEERETAASAGLLGRLLGALNPWRSAEQENETLPQPLAKSEAPAESSPAVEESVPAEEESTPAEPAPAAEESTPVPAESQQCPESGAADSSGSDSQADNPFSIFGLPSTQSNKQETPDRAEEQRPAKGRGKGKKVRQARGKGGPTEPRRSAKKPPMRTARDVINRIQWDRNLPEDYFDIGYLDR
ncbi:Leukocyte receptor cluster member 9 [Amphibalanus amphitrite]|uniref:Leukocyte receptor cluster member 9 n=1 Tax=Amphibalanus amphitrite TaxID=1232801 RepID=A0A6A4VWA2_AMPAM|nr:Leukocyte receptor cluster member 9 [Amphibalanus amphitrite]